MPELLLPILVFMTTMLVVYALAPAPQVGARQRLAPYSQRYASARDRELAGSFGQRLIAPAGRAVIGLIAATAPTRLRERADRDLAQAGYPIDLNTYLAVRGVAMVGLPVGYLGLLLLSGQPVEPVNLIGVALLFLGGGRITNWWIKGRTKRRQEQIERALPNALDLLTVSMEAGLSFDAGLAKVVEKTKGPLALEFGRVLQEMQLGKSRREALRDLGRRAAVRDLSSFVAAIVQADQMGMSLAPVMRAQADDVRTQRRQRAEETAHKAAIKMLFPLIFCILPAMMLVVLGPTFYTLYTEVITHLSGGLG